MSGRLLCWRVTLQLVIDVGCPCRGGRKLRAWFEEYPGIDGRPRSVSVSRRLETRLGESGMVVHTEDLRVRKEEVQYSQRNWRG